MTATPNWFIPHQLGLDFIGGGTTTRGLDLTTAYSEAPWQKLNMGLHVDDQQDAVITNRQLLQSSLELPSEPFWLDQRHGIKVVKATESHLIPATADASYSNHKGRVLAVLSADCLPIILASEAADWVAVVHCGWRSLASGIIKNTLSQTSINAEKIRAWLGPAIGAEKFKVGEDVKTAFLNSGGILFGENFEADIGDCFKAIKSGKYTANLAQLAKIQLGLLGLKWIKGGDYCTFSDAYNFFSYRRDGVTGRMATVAWIK